MSDNIELRSFRSRKTKHSDDIEEYNERCDSFVETSFSPKTSLAYLNEYDFFVQQDVQSLQKPNTKKKKAKKKEKSSNLMDIISSEIAATATPVVENVISYINFSQNSYLLVSPRARKIIQRFKPRTPDVECGWGQTRTSSNLNPVYLGVLANPINKDDTINVEYVRSSKFNEIIAENEDADSKKEAKFLDIELKNVQFKHHHQFSLEKLLVVKLNEVYKEYVTVQNTMKELLKHIKINRDTKDNLKQEFLKISPNRKEELRFDGTLRKYSGTLFDLKDKYLEMFQVHREMVHKIISLWYDIEMIREKTKSIETPYSLEITKKLLDNVEFDRFWNEVYNLEFNDVLDKMEYDYVTRYIEYKEAKSTQNLDDSAKRRINKPKLQIDESLLKEDVEKTVNRLVTKESIEVNLKHDDKVVSKSSHSLKHILKYKYQFKIYIDDVFVCESEYIHTDVNKISCIDFTESFSIQILPMNSDVSIVLLENEHEISTILLNLSDIKTINATSEYIEQHFISNEIIAPTSKYVGSGHNIKEIAAECKVRLKSSNIFKSNLYTNCTVNMKIGWNEQLSQNDSEIIKSSMEIGRQIKRLRHGIDRPNIETLKKIIENVYGKDINNDESVINTLRDICEYDVASDDTFHIDENSPGFIRMKLLHLRNMGGFTNIENKLVPIHGSQISTEQLNCLYKSKETETESQYYSDKFSEMDPIELQRFIGSKYIQKLNINVLRNLYEHLMMKTHKDVVRDFKDLSLRSLLSNRIPLATLANISTCTKQQLLHEGIAKNQDIVVTVVRAFNLRDRSTPLVEEFEDDIAGFKLHPLRPFVKVSYRGESVQTATAIGCHPTWNHTVKINTRLGPLSSIRIDLFDEHRVSLEGFSDSDQSQGRSIRYRCDYKWLGSVRVPIYGVLTLGDLRGTFKVSSPPVIFGYENGAKEQSHSLIPEVKKLMKKDSAFLALQITTSLSHLGGLHEYNLPANTEEDYIIKHLNNFVTEYLNDFPSRSISLTFIDSSGRNKCVTQFLQPIPMPDQTWFPKNPKASRAESALSKSSIPSKSSSSRSSRRKEELERSSQSGEEKESIYSANEDSWKNGENHLTKMMYACLRYVSLTPSYEVTEAHHVTLMGLELLKVVHGSPLDHCILLASYFLHLGVRAYVCVGRGVPRGRSAYVLTLEHFENKFLKSGLVWHVWDACAGERSELRDVACPIQTIDYVFDNENIWVNVQNSQECESMSFDFSKSSDWQPVFDKSSFVMKQPVASDAALYTSPCDPERLRLFLESKIRDKVQKWRPHVKTIWNRYCGGLLREYLPHWEYWSFNPTEPKPAPSQRLKQLMLTYKISGSPLNMAYTSAKSLLSALRSQGTHLCAADGAELALAVHVCSYPNYVLSVWVFLATLTRV